MLWTVVLTARPGSLTEFRLPLLSLGVAPSVCDRGQVCGWRRRRWWCGGQVVGVAGGLSGGKRAPPLRPQPTAVPQGDREPPYLVRAGRQTPPRWPRRVEDGVSRSESYTRRRSRAAESHAVTPGPSKHAPSAVPARTPCAGRVCRTGPHATVSRNGLRL